jgi:PAS domain-containing protein
MHVETLMSQSWKNGASRGAGVGQLGPFDFSRSHRSTMYRALASVLAAGRSARSVLAGAMRRIAAFEPRAQRDGARGAATRVELGQKERRDCALPPAVDPCPDESAGIATSPGAELLHARERRRERERRMAARHLDVLGGLATGIVVLDGAGRVRSVNREAARILSIDATPASDGPSPLERVPAFDPFRGAIRCALDSGERATGEVAMGPPVEGVRAQVRWRVEPLLVHGEVPGAQLLVEDVTELRRRESIARLGTKLDALGQFSASVIHDVKNVLFGLSTGVRTLHDQLGADPDIE